MPPSLTDKPRLFPLSRCQMAFALELLTPRRGMTSPQFSRSGRDPELWRRQLGIFLAQAAEWRTRPSARPRPDSNASRRGRSPSGGRFLIPCRREGRTSGRRARARTGRRRRCDHRRRGHAPHLAVVRGRAAARPAPYLGPATAGARHRRVPSAPARPARVACAPARRTRSAHPHARSHQQAAVRLPAPRPSRLRAVRPLRRCRTRGTARLLVARRRPLLLLA
jgi:hypothetical protein